jgi:hypothetical protein
MKEKRAILRKEISCIEIHGWGREEECNVSIYTVCIIRAYDGKISTKASEGENSVCWKENHDIDACVLIKDVETYTAYIHVVYIDQTLCGGKAIKKRTVDGKETERSV